MDAVISLLINDITEYSDGIIVVLDDFHLIRAREIHQAIAFLLNHQPSHMHLVIITRSDPFLPLSRLRASDQITNIRAEDLRFSGEETNAFLNQLMGLTLSDEQVTSLETRTEGWIAGLQLAALSLKGRNDRAAFIRDLGFSLISV